MLCVEIVFREPVKFDLTLRCSFPVVCGMLRHRARRDPVMFAYMVSRLHAHEMRTHIDGFLELREHQLRMIFRHPLC